MTDVNSKLIAIKQRENPEPEEGKNPWPYAVWLFFGAMMGWGATYMGLQAGDGQIAGGDRRTLIVSAQASDIQQSAVDGSKIFQNLCVACHQQTGLGVAGAFPPLAGSEWVTGDANIPVRILLKGLQGSIQVKGATYNGVMPAFGDILKDDEIAAVVSYIRKEWGNNSDPISGDNVKELREKYKDKSTSWSAEELKQ